MITVVQKGVAYKVPCGKCAFCWQTKRSSWVFRIRHEMRCQDQRGYFLTLTYDEKHVPRTSDGKRSLRFRHVQLMFKRLRKAKYYCKYIAVGEYGTQTQRPHYHLLLWTDAPTDAIEKLWCNTRNEPRGSIHFGTLTVASAMYTLKYILQPRQKPEDGREHARAQFSRGLGLGYLTSSVYEYHTAFEESPVFTSVLDGQQFALPRYYKNKIFTKYQCAREASRVKWQRIREYRNELRKLWKRGRKDADLYLQSLRAENARRILEKQKHTTHL